MAVDLYYRIGKVAARIMMPTFGRLEVIGRDHVLREGPLIIAANHRSNADPPLIVEAFPRPVWFMAKRELFDNPIAGHFLRNVHVYPVDRDGRDIDAVRWAQATLAEGKALLVFPEGTRNREGGLGPATDGLSYLAARTGAPVIPVGITGSERINSYVRIAFPLTRVRVNIGKPFTLDPGAGRPSRERLREMTEEVMSRIAALLPLQ